MDYKINIRLFAVLLLLFGLCHVILAQSWINDVTVNARVGYNIGGTAPVGLPASIRRLNSYTLQPNIVLGIDAKKPLADRLGVFVGLRLETKDMEEDARVKNYHMDMVRGGESISGVFTGDETTKVKEWMFTIPVEAVFSVNERVILRVGPYVSYVISRGFTGYAHDGYLRLGNPTGAKIELGSDEGTRGNYDFTEHMRRMQYGIGIGADWRIYKHFGVYAELNWGLTGIHHSSFKTIEQTLYPIFATIGVTHKLK